METATLKNFGLGVDVDEDRAMTGYLAQVTGIDILGAGGGTATGAMHAIKAYQPSQRMVAEAQSVAPNAVTDFIEWVYPFNGKTYGMSSGGRFYEATTSLGGTWGLKFATSASGGGAGMLPYGSNLYYGQDTVLGKFDGTNGNNNFQTFNSATAGPRPMTIIAGRLAIGNQRNVATLESDETTFNSTRLQLPVGYVVRSMDIWNNFCAIAADFTPPSATNPISSRIFLWDGSASTFSEAFEVPYTSAPLLISNDNFLWIIGGDKNSNMLIYVYNGGNVKRAFYLTNTVPHGLGSRSKFQGNIIFGTNGRTPANVGNGGVWMIGGGVEDASTNPQTGTVTTAPYASSQAFLLSPAGGITGTNTGGLYGEGNNVLAAWFDGTNYGVDKSSATQFPTSGTYIVTLPLHMGEPTKNKMFHSIRPDLFDPGTSTGATFQIQYRKNLATAWTTLKTINQSDASLSYDIPLGFIARRVEFRFNWVVSGSNNPLQLRSFTINYTMLPLTF